MARLHEFQGKHLLAQHGIAIPDGAPAASPQQAADIAARLARPCVVKIQSWSTGRAAIGGVAFATSPAQAAEHAQRMLAMTIGNFPVSHVLVEEKLSIASELFVSLSISDRDRAPVILLAPGGGSGIESRAASVKRILCDASTGPDADALTAACAALPISCDLKPAVAVTLRRLFQIAKASDARSLEINPLVITTSGQIVAADCRITIDDYAVFRHPELNIDIARELDHPPTELERIAYRVEQDDHRGTFFFAQMNLGTPTLRVGSSSSSPSFPSSSSNPPRHAERGGTQEPRPLIGFHGAGGGGSMMSMDAISTAGFTVANFCDTSGNPSPAKVYRAARIILAQPGLVGYFGSGSGVANQEQFWSAYGLAKAFWELDLSIPAVIRLGGNTEDRAVDILQGACRAANLPAVVECYRKTDTPAQVAARFAALVAESQSAGGVATWTPRPPRRPDFVNNKHSLSFPLKNATLWIDPTAWKQHAPAIIARCNGLLKNDNGAPALTIAPDAFLAKDSDMIAAEVECRRDNIGGLFVELPIPGLDTPPATT